MNTLHTLCREIQLPQEVTARVLALEEACRLPTLPLLRREETWAQGLQETEALLGEDPDGFGMLTCMLLCAEDCRGDFESMGLSHEIFVDTMGCFTRFVGEHLNSFGRYGFDRAFWTVRQVSGMLFRLGTLEYELLTEKGRKYISLHIPSDADLRLPALRASYDMAKGLLARFPAYAGGEWVCGSWLLSPNLTDFLPDNSRILGFQKSFTIRDTWADEEFKEWVYGRVDIPNEKLPENTSLQRNVKAFLLSGGAFLSAEGVLAEEPFLSECTQLSF